MKLLVLNRSRGRIGGVEMYLKALLPKLTALGHDVWFAYENEPLPAGESVCDLGAQTRQISTSSSLRALVRELKPDLAFVNGLESAELEATVGEETPVALFLHGYQGACISGAKRHAFPSHKPCERSLGPACLLYYFPRRCGGLNPVSALNLYSTQRQRQRVLQSSSVVIVASRHMRDEAIRNGAVPQRVFIAPLFPTTQLRDAQAPAPRGQSGEILFIGRVTKVKGLALLVQALPIAEARLGKRLKLVVAGDGAEITTVKTRARQEGVDLAWHHWVSPKEREILMRRADLLVLPSLWPEPFGIVGVEAAAVGLPAVAFSTGGILDWLVPGISGEVSTGSPSAVGLADAIVRALGSHHHLEELRLGAWIASKKFSVENHLAALGQAFEATTAIEPGKRASLGAAGTSNQKD
jgi:glycosyltransferase involved in cell wall biosynthesis